MFRGSTYSIETDKDLINNSDLMEEDIRIALIGVSQVGKSSMLNCIENEVFDQDINHTKQFQLRFKKLRINNFVIQLKIWDGAGGRILQFLNKDYLSNIDGFIEVFDLTDKHSLHQLQLLHEEIKKYFKKKGKQFASILVGNKADLIESQSNFSSQSKVTNYLADKFANGQQILYLKTSAKQNKFVKDSFVELLKLILQQRKRGQTSRIFDTQEEISLQNRTSKCPNCSCSLCAIF